MNRPQGTGLRPAHHGIFPTPFAIVVSTARSQRCYGRKTAPAPDPLTVVRWRETIPEGFGHVPQKRKIQIGTALNQDSHRIQGSDPYRCTFNEGIDQAPIECGFVKNANHVQFV